MTSHRHTVLFLLVLSAIINYIDRGSLSVAAPLLSAELRLSPVQTGVLLSAFFWSYALFQPVSGWLIDRLSVRWVFAAGFLLWSMATFCSGLAGSLAMLLFLRLLLGAGESVGFPCYSKVIAAEFSVETRGVPNSLIEAGTKLGPAVGTLIGGLLLAAYGWRVLFFALGAGSLFWLIPWLIWAPRAKTAPAQRESAGVLDIVMRRDAWGTFIGNACYTYAYYFLLTWLPSYLVNERHVSLAMMGILGSAPYLGAVVSALICGWASDAWIRRGATPTRVRKTFVGAGLLLSTVMAGSAIVADLRLSIALLCVAYIAFGMFASNHWAITQTLAGPEAAGKWTGIQNMLGSLSGVAAPIVTGFIVERTGSYYWAFVSPAILAVIGACAYIFMVGEVAPVQFAP